MAEINNNVEIREDGRIVFRSGDKEYKFVNMGEYIGYNSRSPYDKVPEVYRLMAYNETQTDGVLHIEALIDPLGEYSRLIVTKGLAERVLALSGKYVVEDLVNVMGDSNEFVPKDRYVAFEDDFENKREVSEYLGTDKTFKSDSGEVYNGEVTKDSYIQEFMQKNLELSHTVVPDSEEVAAL